jgi:cytochrome d ubiquinol oxidase subunit I
VTELGLARLQFGVTTVYHFLFVPLTIGLSFLLAVMETVYVRTGDKQYKTLIDFFGRLFLINFAVGVVTGILQEFQFGMNWSNYSRFVGDVFGAPLAVEALLAFFLESTFLGVWIFGWERLSPRAHAWAMWLVAIGTSLSAFWILVANSFMQEPVGYAVRHGHAEMVNFFALLGNPQLWVEFPHVELGALATGSFFMLGISAYFLLRGQYRELFDKTFRLAAVVALVSSVLVFIVGHDQAQHLVVAQPMKIAASEALWHTSPEHAPWTVVAIVNGAAHRTTDKVQIPDLLSILAYNHLSGRVTGIEELQHAYVKKYGPGNYIPPVFATFWSFRVMILAGTLMIVVSVFAIWFILNEQHERRKRFLRLLVWAIGLPYLANIMGWIMTEVGRQPWVVFGLETTAHGVSPTVSAGEVVTTLVGFGLLYGAMAAALLYLFLKYIRLGPEAQEPQGESEPEPALI